MENGSSGFPCSPLGSSQVVHYQLLSSISVPSTHYKMLFSALRSPSWFHPSSLLPAWFHQHVQMSRSVTSCGEGEKIPVCVSVESFSRWLHLLEIPGNQRVKTGRMDSSTFNLKNTIFLLLFATAQLSFMVFFPPWITVPLGLPVASRDLCTKVCLGQGLNNLSLLKEFKEGFPCCDSHFPFSSVGNS